MLLGRSASPARALAAALFAVTAAACGDSGNPGGPQTGDVRVTAVSPSAGTTFGGTALTITGSGFAAGAKVQIGGSLATDVTVAGPTTITAKTPAHAAGTTAVTVTVGTKSASLAGGFTFTAPVVGPNTPPVVSALTVQPPRLNQPVTLATIGDRMSLTVSVNDAETPASQLTYEWTATPNIGTFSGTGPAVQWTAPAATTAPQSVALMLTVVERYLVPDTQGLPVQREHRVQRTAVVKVHDTVKEVSDMAVDFLTLFSNSNITSPEAVLHNFSKTCDDGSGYLEEYGDVVYNRENFLILNHTITPPTVFEYAFGSRRACTRRDGTPGDVCVEVPVQWTDRNKTTNAINTASGIDYVTGVYENAQWRLCHSRWTAFSTLTGKPVIMDVTGRGGIIKGPRDK